MDAWAELRSLLRRHSREGRVMTPVPRLSLLCASHPTQPLTSLYRPLFCVVAQGGKRSLIGDRVLEYRAGTCLVVSVDLPVTSEVVAASAGEPYLAVSIALDPAVLAALLLDTPAPGAAAPLSPGLAVSPLPAPLLDPVVRLLRLLDHPDDIAVLAPLVEREILYRLLRGEHGETLRQIALADSRLSQVSRAIEWIRRHYDQPFHIKTVADVANMSPSSLHRHFKAVTAISPLQFQKRVRLQEARRLLLVQHNDAGGVGYAVGYESPSQFSREYARLFGAPPAQDAARLREGSGGGTGGGS